MIKPKHVYECESCGEIVEYTLDDEDKDVFEPKCKWCGGKMKRVFTPIPFVFKGKLNG